MDVQCEKCGTEYALDETLVGPSGTAVRCTSCGHVFKVFPTRASAVPETWMLRQTTGATFPFDRLGVLQDWIAEGKVTVNDQISKSGGEWKRLGDIAEMKPFFDGARRSIPTQPRPGDGVAPAAGHPRHEASEHADTIRVSAPGAPGAPSAPPAPTHTTAQFAAPVPQAAPRSPSVPAPPAVSSSAPTIRASSPAAIQQAHAPTQPAPAPPMMSNAPTIRASAPAPAPAPAPQFAAADAPTLAPMTATPLASQPVAPAVTPAMPPGGPTMTQAPTMAAIAAPPESPVAPPYQEPDLSQVPAATDEEHWDRGQGIAPEGPAWAERDSEPGRIDDDFDEDAPAPRRKIGRWIALFVVLALVAAAFYVFMYQRETARGLLAGWFSAPEADRHQAFYLKGRESFLLDTDQAFKQADREYQKVLALAEDHAPTLAGLGEMYATWAQYTLDAEIDARVDAQAAAAGAPPDNREAERLHREFTDRLAEATRWTEQALAADPELPAAHLAEADIKRLSGDAAAARTHLEQARGPETGPAADYVDALLMIDEGRAAGEVTAKLQEAITAEPMLRALYRRARVFAAHDQPEQAKQVLAKLLGLNDDHPRARALEERIGAGRAVALTVADSTAETAPATARADAGPAEPPVVEEKKPAPGALAAGGGRVVEGGGEPTPAGGSIDSMLQRAASAQENGRVGEASALFKQVLDRQPGNIDALSGMAYCYLDRGATGQAIAHFRRALGVNSNYGPALIGLAGAYKSQGQKAQALKYYKQYVAAHPTGRYATMAKVNVMQLEQALEASGEKDTGAEEPPPASEEASGPAPKPPAPEPPPADKPPADEAPSGGSGGGAGGGASGGATPPPSGGGGSTGGGSASPPPTPPAGDPPASPPPAPPSGN